MLRETPSSCRAILAIACSAVAIPASVSLIACLMLAAGCDFIPERPPLVPPEQVNVSQLQAEAQSKLIEPPSVGFAGDWEAWYGYYLNNQLVGYAQISAKRMIGESTNRANENVIYEVAEQLRFRRGKSTSIQHLSQSSVESRKGELQSFESTMNVGPLVTHYFGTVANEQLIVEITRGADKTTKRIAWEPDYRSMVAVEQSLRRTPMQVGEKRTLKMLFPHRYEMGTVELWCTGQTGVSMLDGSYPSLREIVSTEKIDGKEIAQQVLWTNDRGEIQKQLHSGSSMMGYRMDRQSATIDAVPPESVFEETKVAVLGEIKTPAKAKRVAYIIGSTEDAKADGKSVSVPTTPGQMVRKMDDGSFRVLVVQDTSVTREGFAVTKLQPDDADRKPNTLIDSNHSSIRRIATASIRGQMSEREIALTLARTANDLLNPKTQSLEMVRASTVVQETTGGSAEYAIVLAALLRAKGIASRLAMGIKYRAGDQSMAYHVWTLAFVDGQWVSLDALSGGLAAPDRITFVTTNLVDANQFNAVAAVLTMISRSDIEIKSTAY